MKRKVIAYLHTHWDREWYLSHAKHNYRLVKFFDALIDAMEKDEKFRYFHLDGQIVVIEDYLAVRPEMEAKARKFIAEGRWEIGPFYILQDEYLINGESSVRNALYGMQVCKKYGMIPVIELKDGGISDDGIASLLSLLEQYGMKDTCVIISFSYKLLSIVRKLTEDVYVEPLLTPSLGNLLIASAFGNSGIDHDCTSTKLTEEHVLAAHKMGLNVIVAINKYQNDSQMGTFEELEYKMVGFDTVMDCIEYKARQMDFWGVQNIVEWLGKADWYLDNGDNFENITDADVEERLDEIIDYAKSFKS